MAVGGICAIPEERPVVSADGGVSHRRSRNDKNPRIRYNNNTVAVIIVSVITESYLKYCAQNYCLHLLTYRFDSILRFCILKHAKRLRKASVENYQNESAKIDNFRAPLM